MLLSRLCSFALLITLTACGVFSSDERALRALDEHVDAVNALASALQPISHAETLELERSRASDLISEVRSKDTYRIHMSPEVMDLPENVRRTKSMELMVAEMIVSAAIDALHHRTRPHTDSVAELLTDARAAIEH